MSTSAAPAPSRPAPRSLRPEPGRRVAVSPRVHAVTLAASLWLIVGLFVDGWAHNTRPGLETFFTPWHALFYSGFGVTAAWMGWQVYRAQEAGYRGRDAIPAGYGLGLVGLGIFAVGGAGDLLWHTLLGIEQDIEALFSPTHLLLLLGMALIVTSPLRAAWATDDARHPGTLARFLPTVLSLALCTALVQFFFMYLFAVGDPSATTVASGLQASFLLVNGIAGLLITNLILVAPVLYLLRRWLPPFGSLTVLFGVVGVLLAALNGFVLWLGVPVLLVAGVGGDLLVRALRPSPDRPAAFRAMAVALPVLLWSLHFAALSLSAPVVWAPEFWTGLVVYAGLTGLVLAQLLLPGPTPARRPAAAPS